MDWTSAASYHTTRHGMPQADRVDRNRACVVHAYGCACVLRAQVFNHNNITNNSKDDHINDISVSISMIILNRFLAGSEAVGLACPSAAPLCAAVSKGRGAAQGRGPLHVMCVYVCMYMCVYIYIYIYIHRHILYMHM